MAKEATKTETKPAAKAEAEKKPKGPGIGAFAMEQIKKGLTNEQVLEACKAKFPEAKTSAASINWYRNKLRAEKAPGVLSARELAAKNKPAEDKKPAAKAKGKGDPAA